MKILVIAGDYWHPMELIRREIGQMEFEQSQYEFDFVEDAKDIVTMELLMKQKLVIFAKSNVIGAWNQTPMFEPGNAALAVEDYRRYVEQGGALLSVHAGNTGEAQTSPEWCDFVGNSFISHPARCEVHVYPVKEHPITRGVTGFTEVDEHYELGDISEDAEVFLESVSSKGGTQVAGYARRLGNGKLCVLTPGHTADVWNDTSFVTLFKNAIDWCTE